MTADHRKRLLVAAAICVAFYAPTSPSLLAADAGVADSAPIKVVIVTGHDGPFHNWRETSAALQEVLSHQPRMKVDVQSSPEFLADPELLGYQLVVLNYCNWQQSGLSEKAKLNFLKYLQAGRGLAIIHFANGAFHPALPGAKDADWPEFRKICRRWWVWGKSAHEDLGRFQVDIVKQRPMLAGLSSFETEDELYFNQQGDEPIRVLCTARSKKTGQDEPIACIYDYGKSRVFQTMLGHSAASIRNPDVAEIIRRACLWAATGPNVASMDSDVRSTSGVEPWTNPGLRVTEGLVAWYDGTAESAARRTLGQPEAFNGKALNVWHDGSGKHRDLLQSNEAAQPKMRIDIVLGLIRFDGQSSYLSADNLGLTCKDLTVFVVGTPLANPGRFSAFLAMNATGKNDYVSGLTLDQGPQKSARFDSLNVEGAGFAGPQDFPIANAEPGSLRRICVTSTVGSGGTSLYVDGELAGRRDRDESQIRMDQLTVGARYYTNGGPPATRGFLSGEIAEVLVYNRVLDEAQRTAVEHYLTMKYGNMRPVPLPSSAIVERPVPRLKGPPAVQMLVPGFAARQVPIDLTNVNNVLYRLDGKLMAVTYNGRVYMLSDTNGDGLEDRADVFWDEPSIVSPIGMALTPPGYVHGQGVFIASKGRVVLIVDKDGNDRGDEAIVVSEGWPELKHNVDALGVAVASDGSVVFGLGSASFTKPYQLDEEKRSQYDRNGERGAILKVSADFKHREQVCSGIRFPVAIRFNREGDLFCTDQEGATWLSNGNPLDELLHIQPGRHYGFPPRHPKHLPEVIDEPSVFDYSPQHQSTCGLNFNDPIGDGQVFGPSWWQSDALVTGYSRGKLFRTTLVKTSRGYVAENAVIGCFRQLPADACVSPNGELVVAAHSGGPDWGSGAGGKGTLYKISCIDSACPQPVRAWASSPQEVHVAFDRPLDLDAFKDLGQQVKIEAGRYVRAGDRFEYLRPGYAIVEQQDMNPRRMAPVQGVNITADRRAIILSTAAQDEAVSYNVILPSPHRTAAPSLPANAIAQLPIMELDYTLSGVEATWKNAAGNDASSLQLPHLDLATAQGLLVGSVEADRLAATMTSPGTLTLRTQLDLWQMLQPAIQPGSKLDYERPLEEVTMNLESPAPFVVKQPTGIIPSSSVSEGRHRASINVRPREGQWTPIEVTVETGSSRSPLEISWHTTDDPRPRALQTRRMMLPWARHDSSERAPARATPAELAGGDWHRGRDVFFSEQAQCSKCHSVRGKGGWIGPDLSNLTHRDYASVLRDISQPSFAINPDHLAYIVTVNDGRVLTGMVQTRGDAIVVGDIKGVETIVRREEIDEMTPTLLSIMPEGLPKILGETTMRDLLTFLLVAEPVALEPAPLERAGAPSPRTQAEVDAVLSGAQPTDAKKLKPLQIVLCSGPKDHDIGEHDYPLWQQRWTKLLNLTPHVTVATAEVWPSTEQWQTADAVVMFSANPGWSPERAKELDGFLARGGGLVLLHYAVNGGRAPEEFARRIGLAWQGKHSKFRHGNLDLLFVSDPAHPITVGFTRAQFTDESYWDLIGDPSRIQVLATQVEDGQPRPMLWTFQPGEQGRVFCSLLGHYNWTFDDPLFRVLTLRGLAWVADQPIDRFNDLIARGTRIQKP